MMDLTSELRSEVDARGLTEILLTGVREHTSGVLAIAMVSGRFNGHLIVLCDLAYVDQLEVGSLSLLAYNRVLQKLDARLQELECAASSSPSR